MRLAALVLLMVTAATSAAVALDRVTCADADKEVSLTYDIDPALPDPVQEATMQIAGDFGVSTNPSDRNHDGEFVSASTVGEGFEGADVSWRTEGGRERPALRFRIGRVFEGQRAQIGGVLAVAGGGLWTITCRSSDLGM